MSNTPEPDAEVVQPKQPAVHEKAGHAVMSVHVPARTAEVSLAHSHIEGAAVAAVQAWDKVKGEDDADFAHAVGPFQRELIILAEDVYNGGKFREAHEVDGQTSHAKFQREVYRIMLEQTKAKQDKAKAEGA